MTLTRWQRPEAGYWNPLRQLSSLREEIDRLFDSPLSALTEVTQPFMSGWRPAVDIYEDKDSLIVRAEVPGMRREDLEVSLHNGVLSLSGERKASTEADNAEMHRAERFVGRFQRVFTLPTTVDADKVKAAYKDGILTITLPKTEEARPRQIEVNTK